MIYLSHVLIVESRDELALKRSLIRQHNIICRKQKNKTGSISHIYIQKKDMEHDL